MKNFTVVGLDTGLTATGVARARGGAMAGYPQTMCIRSRARGFERMASMRDKVVSSIVKAEPDLVVVEAPLLRMHKNAAYFHENAGVFWQICCELYVRFPLVQVPGPVLKKFATGKGNADKTQMVVAAVRRFDGIGDQINDDQADALWLAAAGLQHYGQPIVRLPELQIAALEATKSGRPVVAWPSLDRLIEPPKGVQSGG